MNRSIALASLFALACGGAGLPQGEVPPLEQGAVIEEGNTPPTATMTAPPSGPARDVHFPPIERTALENGLELNVVESHQLPVVYLRLVIRSGAETDPRGKEGLADLVAQMLREGTRGQTSAQIAERIEFLGADVYTGGDEESVHLVFRALSQHLDESMQILADLATEPAFRAEELVKLKRRENDRLVLSAQQPGWLAHRELYRRLYGDAHPYAHADTTTAALARINRGDLVRWHRTHFVPSNAFVVAVGDVTPAQVRAAASEAFGSWSGPAVESTALPEAPARTTREVVVVDRPGSVQSTIYVGNLAIARGDEAFIPLDVANQVLGGSAASRLFMDLRERRSLTYGAYSQVGQRVGVAPFVAYAAVRTEVTADAMSGLYEHLDRIVRDAPSADEIQNATTYLSDSFPLQIDTPAKIAAMVADLRIFGLDDDYWDGYRTAIRAVTPQAALAAARGHIRPDRALVVVVGTAADIAEPLRRYGNVTVVDAEGRVKMELEARAESTEDVPNAESQESEEAP